MQELGGVNVGFRGCLRIRFLPGTIEKLLKAKMVTVLRATLGFTIVFITSRSCVSLCLDVPSWLLLEIGAAKSASA